MSDILTRMIAIASKTSIPHVRLPPDFMTEEEEPKEFVGDEFRVPGAPGFVDDRLRRPDGVVDYAPRKWLPNLRGAGKEVDENYPQSVAASGWPTTQEANVPRQTRGQKADTLTEIHDERTEFPVASVTFNEITGSPINKSVKQPPNPFNARYPYNHARVTESGHLFEADDTPGSERIKESHRTGTYYEVGPDGSRVTKVIGDDFTVIVGDGKVNIQGSAIVTIDGDCNLFTNGNFNHQVHGDYNLLVEGKKTEKVKDNVVNDYHSDFTTMIGRSTSVLAAGVGTGNEGGHYKVSVAGDYKIETQGNVIETFGKALPSLPITCTRTVFGNQTNQTLGLTSFRTDQVDGNHVESVGGYRSSYVVGDVYLTTELGDINTKVIIGNQSTNVLLGSQVNNVAVGSQSNTIGGLQLNTITGTQTTTASSITHTGALGFSATATQGPANLSALGSILSGGVATVTATQGVVAVSATAGLVSISSTGTLIDTKNFLNHQHTGVTTGAGTSGIVA